MIYYSADEVTEIEKINMVATRLNPKNTEHLNISISPSRTANICNLSGVSQCIESLLGRWVTGKMEGLLPTLLENYGHASVEDIGILALIFGGSRAIMKNYAPKLQEGFKGDARKTWNQSSSGSPAPALDIIKTICTGDISNCCEIPEII